MSQDTEMNDAASAASNSVFDEFEAGAEGDEEEEPQEIKLLPGSTPTAASFQIRHETHTLGNALRYVIMKNPDVEFCAYAVPHPSESRITLRIQTYEGTTAIQALKKGLKDVQELCDVVTDKFQQAREDFSNQMSE